METEFPSNFFFDQYKWLLSRERSRPEECKQLYTEKHHVYPKSVFGETAEMVNVGYKHHVILHYLLYRGFQVAYGNKHEATRKMHNALICMVRGASLCNRKDHTLRSELSLFLVKASKRYASYSPEILEHMSRRATERYKDPKAREASRAGYDGMTEEARDLMRAHMSAARKGYEMPEGQKELRRAKTTNDWKDIEVREKRLQGMRESTPDRAARLRAKWADPVWKAALLERRRKSMESRTPEQKELAYANMLRANQSEEKKEALRKKRVEGSM